MEKLKGTPEEVQRLREGPYHSEETPPPTVRTSFNSSLFIVMDGSRMKFQTSRRESSLSLDTLRLFDNEFRSSLSISDNSSQSSRYSRARNIVTKIFSRDRGDFWVNESRRRRSTDKYPTTFLQQYWLLTTRSFKQSSKNVLSGLEVIRHICQAVIVGLLWFRIVLSEERIIDIEGVVGLPYDIDSFLNFNQ